MPITFDIILVLIAIVFILYSLYREIYGPAFTFLLAIIFLGVFNVLTADEIIYGFANVQVANILLLLLLGDIVRKTAFVESVFDRLFRSAKSYRGFLSRMMLIVATFSSFLNNTPLVAVMMPYVHSWCKRNNFSPAKFLIPLSYAAILGGSVTLVGTSTNLIVDGMARDQGLQSLNMFDFAYAGIPMVIIGFLYIIFLGYRLLPGKTKIDEEDQSNGRKYFIEARIKKGSHLISKKLGSTGLRNHKGLFLVEIIKEDKTYSRYELETILEEDDVLVFAGENEKIADLVKSGSGLIIPEIGSMTRRKKAELVELVVSQNSTYIGKSVRETNFRARNDAAVLAVHRNAEQINTRVGQVVLRAGDVILAYAGDAFAERTRSTRDFYFMSSVQDFVKIEGYKIGLIVGGMLLAIILAALNVVSLFLGLIVLLVLSFLLKLTTPKELPKSIDYNLALIIVLSLALGTAMIKTNAAEMLADGLISVFEPFGVVGVLFGIYLITTILAAYITNKAAVGIIFPIAITIAENMGVQTVAPFVLTVAYAAAANFMTPIGYQTNLMVYGPGGYSFKDFFVIGLPLTILYMVTTITILTFLYF